VKGSAVGLLAAMVAKAIGPAAALSCDDHDVRKAYWEHQEARESYLLVHGTLSNLRRTEAEGVNLPPIPLARGVEVWSADIKGFRASPQAFDQPFEAEVTLIFPDYRGIGGGTDTAHAVNWLPGETGLVWLRNSENGYQLMAGLCRPLIDTDPESMIPALDCVNGHNCPRPG
jgi:hypothetical protein